MNDSDLIQRNQIVIMRALALLMPKSSVAPHEMSVSLLVSAGSTQEYLNAKLNKTPLPALHDTAKQTGDSP